MDIATSRVTLDSFKGMTFYLCYKVAKKNSSDFKMYPVFSRSKMDFCLNEEPLFSSPENEYSELPSKLAYFIDFCNCYIIFDRLHSSGEIKSPSACFVTIVYLIVLLVPAQHESLFSE